MKRAVLGALLFLAAASPIYADASDKPLAGKVIVLDPGHAVLDDRGKILNPGARARRGVYERDVALSVSDKLQSMLEAQGARVYMTRTIENPWRYAGTDRQSDNRSRAVFANVLHADIYVRIHCDWNRSRHFKGFTTYYYRWRSRRLGETIRAELVQNMKSHKDNGLHRRTFVSATAKMPTVLVELGVLSYKPEAKELAMDAYQTRLAQAISSGIVDYFEGKKVDPLLKS